MWTVQSYHHALQVDLCRGCLVLFQNKGSQLWNIMTCKPICKSMNTTNMAIYILVTETQLQFCIWETKKLKS
jgi:hypothetical protein